ncbi:amino acid permease [Sphingomonas koreensis]|uniref:amino acid permease n=1 Tax=Sphingomonas koreensis TaxID=93064 RepID=UPI00082FA98D|nr:amino acid permease [Sphingomonas koreensis]PJI87306.1 APA family basic amino acid/polyamine antiporter [Sphingomonas koreensis]RSU59493.1 amino acid permease [Sphingomonas koreensis]RSU68648.1 amino acid permease [Sphingomonas koreensis]
MADGDPSTPRRALGFWPALALVVGNMIGSGIYLLPATLAPLGTNALIGWVATIAGAMTLAFVFARLAAKLPCAGGPYAFADAAFGPVVGFAVAWSYWILIWAGNGALAIAVVSALSVPFPVIASGLPAFATALLLIWGLVAVNIRGVALAGRIQLVTAVTKLVPLVAIILLALWLLLADGRAAIVENPTVPISAGAISAAVALTFWGFLGVESATVPADRVKDAARVVPLVTLIGTALTGLVYVLVAGAIGLMMPADVTAASPAPLAAFLGRAWGTGALEIAAIFAAISALGALNGFILLQGEMPWAMARGGVFPAWFGKESPHGTPARAHLVSGVLVTVVMALNYTGGTGTLFADIATISLAAGMLAYFVSALAALKLLAGDRAATLAAMVAALFVLWMIYGLGLRANLWGLGLLALGLPVFLWVRRTR